MHHDTQHGWLDAAQIARIRGGFAAVAGDADRFTADFYARLFEIAPTLRPLFPADLADQRDKLKHVLALLVASLDRPATLHPALASLGERHRSYGVVRADFVVVGQSLVETLASHLGAAFEPADRAAWLALYGRVTAIMTAGSRRPAVAA